MHGPGEILVVSCYELGHQPIAAASAVAFLERAGYRPEVVDLAVDSLDRWTPAELSRVRLAAISVPMHTALHIGVAAARRIREAAPGAHICFVGLYAALNAGHLLDGLGDSTIGGEFEEALVGIADDLARGRPVEGVREVHLARLAFATPRRAALPGLRRYAQLEIDGETRLAGAIEASRGCLHLCRHCPIPPVYEGRFFVVPKEIVLADVTALVKSGARHVTFADPDFFNGPGHSMAIVRALHERFPGLTFDITTKVEHVLRHRQHLDELAASGCAFVVSAVESLSDEVLEHLHKGHTRADVFAALEILRAAGIALRPSLVAFTPWTRLGDFVELLGWVEGEDLVHHVDPVQLSIRLLVPPGSLLAESEAMQPSLGPLRPDRFAHTWKHPDPRMDRLHTEVSAIVREAATTGEDARKTFERIRRAARVLGGDVVPPVSPFTPARAVSRPPRLTEPWFC